MSIFQLLASQPSGAFAHLRFDFEIPKLTYYPPRLSNTRNTDTRTLLVGNVRRRISVDSAIQCDSDQSPYVALCLADGTILLVDVKEGHENPDIIWCAQLHVRGELFGLSKTQLTLADNCDSVCACQWNGTTYVFNHRREILRFMLGQACHAFTAGQYAVKPCCNEPVLVYATFEPSIIVYHHLGLDRVPVRSLIHDLINLPTQHPLRVKLSNLGIDGNQLDTFRLLCLRLTVRLH
ncbi:unnamed protein product [Protopolystoma xenopodis]|uniref:Uncharacterized protein n=1 Tax=Protopolystoma xenopodis TaxID=117903 RepID=A0A448WN92_9PLAT|nr:unnamed protein product [Protopolystoma xenopodis]